MKRALLIVSALFSFVAMSCHAQEELNLSPILQNPGFESPSIAAGGKEGKQPDRWFFFCSIDEGGIGITSRKKKSGLQSVMFKAQTTTNSHQGIAQKFRARPGYRYTFSVYAMVEPSDLLTEGAYGQVSLEWRTGEGKEIGRVYGSIWNESQPSGQWSKHTVEADVPKGAAVGTAVITFFNNESKGSGLFYVDDCEFNIRLDKKR